MLGPFSMMPMCDCRTNRVTGVKECTAFLRAFVLDCNGIRVLGDYDYNGRPYRPRGDVSSENKCCECCSCGEPTTMKLCYDLGCLVRREEVNGGLYNISILDAAGNPGGEIVFDPPANALEVIAAQMNAQSYLGYSTWEASTESEGFLCVTVPKGPAIPGMATGSRFRRFITTDQNGGPSYNVASSGYGTYSKLADTLAPGYPNATAADVLSSHIHFYNQIELTVDQTAHVAALPFSGGILQPTNVFRAEFQDASSDMRVANYPNNSVWYNIWGMGGTNIPLTSSARGAWENALSHWLNYIIGVELSIGKAVSYTSWSNTNSSSNAELTVYRGRIAVDVPCNVVLKSMHTLQINPAELSDTNVITGGFASTHRYEFSEVSGAGNYESRPYVDGAGGSTSWSSDCAWQGPF